MQSDVRPTVCAPRVAWCDGGGVAGVEDVVGFAPPVVRWVRGGMDALLGSRIATPGFCLARFDARRACGPAVCRRDGVAVRGGLRTG